MDASLINWPAVFVAALSGFAVGGIWYSPALFGNAWMADSKLTMDEIQKGNKTKIFGFVTFLPLSWQQTLPLF
jgi:hypothetical protein